MMNCALCMQPVTLLDLDAEGWMGEPAHEVCAKAARKAAADAIDTAARQVAERRERQVLARAG